MRRIILCSALLACFANDSFAQRGSRGGAVSVRGHVTKNGAYVPPHHRSGPDGSRINNWSFPGNVNPYTGRVATGDPSTYLLNHSTRGAVLGSYTSPELTVPSFASLPVVPAYTVPPLPKLPADFPLMPPLPVTKPVAPADVAPRASAVVQSTPTFNSARHDASTTQYWREKVRSDHGIEASASASTYQLMELDTQYYWVKKVNRDHGLSVPPGQYSTYQLMDMDTRIYWAKKIAREHGIQFDWQTQTAYQLMDADTRIYWAKKVSAKTGQAVDWRKYTAYQLMALDMR